MKGDARRVVAVIGDGAMSAGMAFEALNNAGTAGRGPARHPERQRDVDLGAGRGASTSTSPSALVALLQLGAARRQGSAVAPAAGQGAGQALGRAHEGHGASRHAVRGARLQLHRPDRRPRRRRAGDDARQRARARGPAVPARRSRRRATATRAPRTTRSSITASRVRPRAAASCETRRRGPRYTQVFGDWLCDMAERRPARSSASRRRCAKAPASCASRRSIPTRYFDVGIAEQHAVTFAGGPRLRGHEAGGGDLLDVPAARLRPADPRRRAAEPAGGLRPRSGRAGRRRRRDARRRVRPVATCAASPTCW